MAIDIKTEVAGTIWTIDSPPGTTVGEGDSIVTVESMKMEIPVETPQAGTVAEVLVAAGEAVEEGQIVARLG
ncbi:MAG: acetyl-CoA carboxylase biotin carboxyl carrier protein subunit [Burkholderiaceae bacterium]